MSAEPIYPPRIYLGLGANLPSRFGSPRETLEAAVAAIAAAGIEIRRVSPWYESAPVPRAADQPWYVNGVVEIATDLDPAALLGKLQRIELDFGRVRSVPNAPRSLDLDVVAYGDRVVPEGVAGENAPLLPHPRMHSRAFVLLPLRDLAPDWHHPQSGRPIADLIADLGRLDDPLGQEIRPLV